MRELGVWGRHSIGAALLLVTAGCGLVLDLREPDKTDGGSADAAADAMSTPDSGARDGSVVDASAADGMVVDPDGAVVLDAMVSDAMVSDAMLSDAMLSDAMLSDAMATADAASDGGSCREYRAEGRLVYLCTPRTREEADATCAEWGGRVYQPRLGSTGLLETLEDTGVLSDLLAEEDYIGVWVGARADEEDYRDADALPAGTTAEVEARRRALARTFAWEIATDPIPAPRPALAEWAADEPNASGPPGFRLELCAELVFGAPYGLNDVSCADRRALVCERPGEDDIACYDEDFVCDGIDDDCDGLTDEPTPSVGGAVGQVQCADHGADCWFASSGMLSVAICPPTTFDDAAALCHGLGMRLAEPRDEEERRTLLQSPIATITPSGLRALATSVGVAEDALFWNGARITPGSTPSPDMPMANATLYHWLSDDATPPMDSWVWTEPSVAGGCRASDPEQDNKGVARDCAELNFPVCIGRPALVVAADAL